jgi:hypothetical protein
MERSDANAARPIRTAHVITTTTITLVTVSVVDFTPATPIPPVTHTQLPTFSGGGTLNAGKCSVTSYTLLNDTATAFFIPFIGCDGNRPECCPFTPNNVMIAGATSGGTVTLTATGTATPGQSLLTFSSGYPVPGPNDQHATLSKCPDDYDDYGTACCPRSYSPFTRAVAGQTPCYSSLVNFDTSPRTLTAGVDFPYTGIPGGQQTSSSQASGASSGTTTTSTTTSSSVSLPSFPTSAVVNVVWAMQYPKSGSSSLSAGAIAGIAVGSVAGVGAIVLIGVYFFWRSRRNRKMNQNPTMNNNNNAGPVPPMQQQPPPPMQQGQPGQPIYYPAPQPQGYYAPPGQEQWKDQAYVAQTQVRHRPFDEHSAMLRRPRDAAKTTHS